MTDTTTNTDKPCRFCNRSHPNVQETDEGAMARRDGHPVTPGHTLIIPLRHVASYGDLTEEEILACHQVMNRVRARLKAEDPTIEGFNIGINDGKVAGQSIFHVHMHLIPRRRGDVEDPRGGVRHLIPGKGYYHDKVKPD